MSLSATLTVVSECQMQLERMGYSLRDTTDYRGAISSLLTAGKSYLTPTLSPSENDFTSDNCFWLLLEFEGSVVGGIGARRERLGSQSLGSFLRASMRRQYGGGELDQIESVSSFLDNNVRGDVAYFGDLVLHDGHRAQGNHLRYFTMYAQLMAAIKWDADWQYSFISFDRAVTGGAFTYGFSKVIPGAQKWYSAPGNRSSDECCVISSREDLADCAEYFSIRRDKLGIVQHEGAAVVGSDRSKSA